MKVMTFIGAVLAAASGASGTSPHPDPVSSFQCTLGGSASIKNVKVVADAYGWRSVTIMEAALAGDASRLSKMVDPKAKFTLFQGDVGNGPRSSGPEAAIEFARLVKPVRYQFATGSGPFSTDPCGAESIDVTLDEQHPGTAAIATFKYEHGLLVVVTAGDVDVVRGDLSAHKNH
jgi:hypothetical protein